MFTPGQSVVIGVGIVMAAALGFTTALAVRGDATGNDAPNPAASPAAVTTSKATPSSAAGSPSRTPSATKRATSGPCTADIVLENSWDQGFQVRIDVTNTSSKVAADWTMRFSLPAGIKLKDAWNATYSQKGTAITAEAPSWARDLAPGATASIGFNATGVDGAPPATVSLNGATCS